MSEYHTPVLVHESIAALVTNPSGIYADVKFGGGGHILAAGCNFDESLSVDDAEKTIVPELIKAVHKAG